MCFRDIVIDIDRVVIIIVTITPSSSFIIIVIIITIFSSVHIFLAIYFLLD